MNNGKNTNAARALAMGVAAALVIVGMAGTGAAVSGLVGEWHFDGNAQDSSGNGNHGTISGATFVTGISGQALSFDGVDDGVNFGDPASGALDFGATDSFTVELFGKFDGFSSPRWLIQKGGPNLGLPGYGIAHDANILEFGIGDPIGSGTNTPVSSLSTGKWYHIAGVRDVVEDKIKLYVDGVLVNVVTDTTTGTLATTSSFFIGRRSDGYYFDGSIDEVRIYNRALTASEIQAEYNALTSTPTPTTPAPTTPAPTTPTPTPTSTTGSISVSSSPSGAGISLDGSYRGTAPKTLTDVSQGSHTVELTLAGYEDWFQTMSVNAGGTYYVSAQLKPLTTPTYTATTTPTYTALPTPTPSKPSASVSLHGEKTDVVLGEDILLKLSAVNLITKPKMHVQVIIIPPSGMSVTSSEFSKSGAGQFTSNYELEPGDGRDIEVRIQSNQVGDFNVNGRVVYYFGDDKDTGGDSTLSLPIKVREVASVQNPIENSAQKSIPGFGGAVGMIGLLFIALLKKRRR